jgi:hypothetical protein
MPLSQFVKVASSKRPCSETSKGPSVKRVRFGVEVKAPSFSLASEKSPQASSPEEVAVLIEKVRRRACLRKQRARKRLSPSPPLSSSRRVPRVEHPKIPVVARVCSDDDSGDSDDSSNNPIDLDALERRLKCMEEDIRVSAVAELQLMNQSKKLRDDRARLTRRYKTMAAQFSQMQQASNVKNLFQVKNLPPVLEMPLSLQRQRQSVAVFQLAQPSPPMVLSVARPSNF